MSIDHGVFSTYNNEALHNAVANGGNGFPVPQGQTVQQTATALKLYVYNLVREEDNCVKQLQRPGGIVYFPHVFHRMMDHQYRQVKAALTEAFITENAPLAQWSLGLNHPLGTVFKITGGGDRNGYRDSGPGELYPWGTDMLYTSMYQKVC